MLARPAGKRSAQTLRGCLCHVAGATRISVCIDSLKVSRFGETVSVSSSSETFVFASVLGASITLDSACKWKGACSSSPCALDTETEPHRPGAKQKFVSHPSGSWEGQDQRPADSVLGEPLVLACRRAHSCFVLVCPLFSAWRESLVAFPLTKSLVLWD